LIEAKDSGSLLEALTASKEIPDVFCVNSDNVLVSDKYRHQGVKRHDFLHTPLHV
jgi:hypothetical protein